jgi:hypothetical protein
LSLSAPGEFSADEYTFEGLLFDAPTEERVVWIELSVTGRIDARTAFTPALLGGLVEAGLARASVW